MPRRFRFSKRRRFSFDEFDLALGPDRISFSRHGIVTPDQEQAALDEMRAWYEANGAEWEREQIQELPGRRSWAWWTFAAREAMPASDSEFTRLQELDVMTVEEEAEAAARSRSANP